MRPDSPSYSSREIGSSGRDRISKAQSNREIASHNSRSATWIPGQMRRLRTQKPKGSVPVDGGQDRHDPPRSERPMVPIHGVRKLARFGTRQCVAEVAIWVESKSVRRIM